MSKDGYVFGLDIGTRSIVGTVGYRVGTDRFVVVAQVSVEHTTRAVIDGQIHDIQTVARTIAHVKARLEEQIGGELKEVSIAAAGRVLKTKNVYVEYEMPSETKVTQEHIHSLDSLAVEKAYDEIRTEVDHKDKRFYCVGYSPVKYYLNGYPMEMIEEHMASSIGVDMIATFLPDEVVEGLYSAVEDAGLQVASLTLEPIAAINIAIPERFRLLNIALVDVGAGTSDISIVKDGSIIAFGMIPLAGDEITEAIARKYLVDFESAERIKKVATKKKAITIKNIMGEVYKLDREEIQQTAKEAIDLIVTKVSEKIIELNGGNSVSAVFVVGGGGKMPGFTERMSECLSLPENRVSIRGAEVLQQIDFTATGVKKDSTLVTPIGICLEYYEQKSSFIHVRVNDERIKVYDNGKATILDACIHAGFIQSSLFPTRGESLQYFVNGEEREIKGRLGEVAEVTINGNETNLNELVHENDIIQVRAATRGEAASQTLGRVPEYRKELQYTVFGKIVLCPVMAEVNQKRQTDSYEIQKGDRITIIDTYSVEQLLEFVGLPAEERVLVDGKEQDKSVRLENGAVIEKIQKKPKEKVKNVIPDLGVPDLSTGQDPLLAPPKPLPSWAADLPLSTPSRSVAVSAAPLVPQAQAKEIEIEVNGKKVRLPAKANHTFVDVFDAYPIDLTKPGGTRLVSRLNGMDITDFTLPICSNDSVDLYWEK